MSEYLDSLRTQLKEAGARFETVSPEPLYTAQETAASAHVPGHAFAKSVMVASDGQSILVALPAPHVIDMDRLGKLLGANLRLAIEEEFRDLFPGCELGAIPPFAPGANVALYVDKGLLENREIAFKVGSHGQIARLRSEDYFRLASPRVLDFAVEPEPTTPLQPPSRGRRALARGAEVGWLFRAMTVSATLAGAVLAWRAIRPDWLRRSLPIFAGGMSVGGALVALADPRTGRRRRALVRDKGGHYLRLGLRRGSGSVRRFMDRNWALRHRLRQRAEPGSR
jgi:Ala-tRNA(Pro) deacylase